MEKQLTEKQRVAHYYSWENDVKGICDRIEKIPTSETPIREIAKSLSSIVTYAESLKKGEIFNQISASIPIEGTVTKMPFKQLYSFILRKGLDEANDKMGFGFKQIKIVDLPENPFAHPLSKSMGIQPISKSFFEGNELLTVEAYDKILEGKITKNGLWNTDLSKAYEGLKDFALVKRLIHKGEKTFIVKYYAKALDIPIEKSIEFETMEALHDNAYNALQKGIVF